MELNTQFELTLVVTVTDVVFSTAHKAKGLEFSTVRVADDFHVMPNPDGACKLVIYIFILLYI